MRPLVYVIMPVGSDPDYPVRRARIEAALRGLGMDGYFPLDHHPHDGDFDAAAMRFDVQRCTVALADLTLERPSCYYELGVAHGAGLPAVLVAAAATKIHQTADRGAVAFYHSYDELQAYVARALHRYALAAAR